MLVVLTMLAFIALTQTQDTQERELRLVLLAKIYMLLLLVMHAVLLVVTSLVIIEEIVLLEKPVQFFNYLKKNVQTYQFYQ